MIGPGIFLIAMVGSLVNWVHNQQPKHPIQLPSHDEIVASYIQRDECRKACELTKPLETCIYQCE
jgi:hypothetical protein